MKVFFAPFPKNKYARFTMWLIIFFLLLIIMLLIKPGMPVITKEDALKAVNNMQQLNQYRWHITSNISFKGVNNNLSNVAGEKNQQSISLKGTFLKSPLELVQIKNVTYRLDPISKQWIVIKDNDIATEEVLNTELNPLAALNFSAINSFSSMGVEYIDDKKVYRVELQPEVSSTFLAKYWSDFNYVIWLDKDLKYLSGFELTAKNRKDDTGKVHMKVLFKDLGEKVVIKEPL